MAWYAGVDLGATNVRAVVGDRHGTVHGVEKRRTPRGDSGIEVTEAVLGAIRDACADAGVDPIGIEAAGVGSIGPLDKRDGVVRDPANLPDDIDVIPLTGPIENLIGGPVSLHNDANAGVIGERFYAEHNPDNMIYLTISSGIGAGVIVDGCVLSGWDGNAGEVGHMTVDPERGEETALPLGSDEFDARDVFGFAGEDAFADQVLERVGTWNAQGVATLVHAYAPMIIYIGGAVALNNPGVIVDRLRDRLPSLVMTNVPDVQLTTLGDDVVVKGALASAITDGSGAKAGSPRPAETE
ncbi:glucokinase [Halobacteriales archaeon QH_2_66_30]|nr:MAG: glucokinase [Halobacteriales archaeon QH_2_66_30]